MPRGTRHCRHVAGSELYVGGGLGFDSNDARGSTISVDPVSGNAVDCLVPLVRSRGGEIGLRTSTSTGFRASAALRTLALDSERLFVGDAGTTEPVGGVEDVHFHPLEPRQIRVGLSWGR